MRKPKVLLAAQDTSFQQHIASSLQMADYLVVRAKQGEEILPLMYDSQPDLVLFALNDFQGEGWRLLEKVRSFTQVPIIVMADHFSPADFRFAGALLIDDFITYPSLLPNEGERLSIDAPDDGTPLVRERLAGGQRQRAGQRLTAAQLTKIDHALAEEGVDEVWLIKHAGCVRFLGTLKQPDLKTERA
jgi:CheY-like chemotaxis protein